MPKMESKGAGGAFLASPAGGLWWVLGHGKVFHKSATKGEARRIAAALNSAYRKETFKPKSAGRRARSKGLGFEREVAVLLRPFFPNARRHLEYQDAEANGVDLVETGDFRFQCKKLKTYAPVTTLNEIDCERAFGEVPVLVTSGDNLPAVAVLYFEDFLWLLKSLST